MPYCGKYKFLVKFNLLKSILDFGKYAVTSNKTIDFIKNNRLPVVIVFIYHEQKVKKQHHVSLFLSFEGNLDVFKGSLISNPNRVKHSFNFA